MIYNVEKSPYRHCILRTESCLFHRDSCAEIQSEVGLILVITWNGEVRQRLAIVFPKIGTEPELGKLRTSALKK